MEQFRLSCTKVAVTYAQSGDLTREDAANHINNWATAHGVGPTSGIVALELHADGHPHLHLAVRFARKIDIRNARVWDIDGHHPNIKAAKDWPGWKAYVLKSDPHPLRWGLDPEDTDSLEAFGSERELLAHLLRTNVVPGRVRLMMDLWRLQQSARLELCARDETLEMKAPEWWSSATDAWTKLPSYGTMLLYGPPGTGKTRWYYANLQNYFVVNFGNYLKAWRDYAGQTTIVIEEFTWRMPLEVNTHLRSVMTETICSTPSYYGSKALSPRRRTLLVTNCDEDYLDYVKDLEPFKRRITVRINTGVIVLD